MPEAHRLPVQMSRRMSLALLGFGGIGLSSRSGLASDKAYSPGVTDTEIKIGQTIAYSGPASAFGMIGRSGTAYYKMINDQGGVNGRKINCISLDDGYSPPKTVELVRRLVESENVFAMFGTLGSPTNVAIQRYLNEHKVPHLMVFSGAARFRNPGAAPWTMGGDLAFVNQTRAFARYILTEVADPKIAVLMQNDEYGKDHLTGLSAGLGDRAAATIVKVATYEPTDPTVDSQIIALKESGANVLVSAAIPKFAAQAIRKMNDIAWKPVHLLGYPGASIPVTFATAGMEASVGVITAEFLKQAGDPMWANDPEMAAYLDFLKKYAPDLNPNDKFCVFGYYQAAATAKVLGMCGDNLTRENLLNQMTHLRQLSVPMFLPGITMSTTPDDYAAIKQMQLQRFDGKGWQRIGEVVEG